jgi:hypothetical protein
MDVEHNSEDEDLLKTSPIRLAAPQIDRVQAENDGPWSDHDDLRSQNRLLRLAAGQMQAEIFTLSGKLEALFELNEKLNDLRQENRRLRAAMEHGLQAATEQYSQQLRVIYASSSWRLTRPWRAIGRFLKSTRTKAIKGLRARPIMR